MKTPELKPKILNKKAGSDELAFLLVGAQLLLKAKKFFSTIII